MKTKRLYSLFRALRSNTRKNWERVSPSAYYKENAIRVYQNQLINSAFDPIYTYELRVVLPMVTYSSQA